MRNRCITAFALLASVGCAANVGIAGPHRYQARGDSSLDRCGYEETELASGKYLLTYTCESFVRPHFCAEQWVRRAGELCGDRYTVETFAGVGDSDEGLTSPSFTG
ncbi:MAG: hypothetical protein AAF658_06310, partial [Myxococcota bacterium]